MTWPIRCLVVAAYALAMAWVESALVFYLRTMLDRKVPYQPNPLPEFTGFGFAELVREAATLVMLVTVGMLAGRSGWGRTGYTLMAFGIWDIAYYIWLIPLTGWPTGLGDWDILFLIPLPWWGPVWAPVSIAVLMITFGMIVTHGEATRRAVHPGRPALLACVGGGLVALEVFMLDALGVVWGGGGVTELRRMLPVEFASGGFLVGLALLSVPVLEVGARAYAQRPFGADSLDYGRWIDRFRRNRQNRVEPDWNAPVTLPAATVERLLPSLRQFQLGDGGGECRLIAWDAGRVRGRSRDATTVVDLWFREEAEHARLLGCAVDRFGGGRIRSHWSYTAFCGCRRWFGVAFELQVLTLTELVSSAYYRVLRRWCEDAPVRAMCGLILRDEAGHLAFQEARMRAGGVGGWGWRLQFWVCGLAAAGVLWWSHRAAIRAIGGDAAGYFRAVRREIGRFVARLGRAPRRSPRVV